MIFIYKKILFGCSILRKFFIRIRIGNLGELFRVPAQISRFLLKPILTEIGITPQFLSNFRIRPQKLPFFWAL